MGSAAGAQPLNFTSQLLCLYLYYSSNRFFLLYTCIEIKPTFQIFSAEFDPTSSEANQKASRSTPLEMDELRMAQNGWRRSGSCREAGWWGRDLRLNPDVPLAMHTMRHLFEADGEKSSAGLILLNVIVCALQFALILLLFRGLSSPWLAWHTSCAFTKAWYSEIPWTCFMGTVETGPGTQVTLLLRPDTSKFLGHHLWYTYKD